MMTSRLGRGVLLLLNNAFKHRKRGSWSLSLIPSSLRSLHARQNSRSALKVICNYGDLQDSLSIFTEQHSTPQNLAIETARGSNPPYYASLSKFGHVRSLHDA